MGELFQQLLHADELLAELLTQYEAITYWIIFAIIFIETGLVVVAFFPGDGLLFSTGILAAAGQLELSILLPLLSIATIAGNTSNYLIGRYSGEKLLQQNKFDLRFYLEKTNKFFVKYGAWAVSLSRFFPFMRTLVPFVAGTSKMPFGLFTQNNVIGGLAWIFSYVLLGYFTGEIPWVKAHFGLIFSVLIVFLFLLMVGGIFRIFLKKLKADN